MRESFIQAIDNLRANKLRSFLTMFGIMWGIVSIVVLSALGEGFRRGNDAVLREFGRNMSIVWGSRTTKQAGGERAGRLVTLTVGRRTRDQGAGAARQHGEPRDPARHEGQERLRRGVGDGARRRAAVHVHADDRGRSRPPAELVRRGERHSGGGHRLGDVQAAVRRADAVEQQVLVDGTPFTIVGRIRPQDQDSGYGGPDNNKIFVPFAVMEKHFPAPRRAGRQSPPDARDAP